MRCPILTARFIKGAFDEVRGHFERGLEELQRQPAVDVDLTRRSDTEFVAEVFVGGKQTARCRIWLGGVMGGGDQIGYYEGDYDMSNALNDALGIVDDPDTLALRAWLSIGLGADRLPANIDPQRMSPEDAAEYLWQRFMWWLE